MRQLSYAAVYAAIVGGLLCSMVEAAELQNLGTPSDCISLSKFVYWNQRYSSPLNSKRVRAISDHIIRCGVAIEDIWFGRVLDNDRSHCWVDFFVKPAVVSEEFSKGTLLFYDADIEKLDVEKKEAYYQKLKAAPDVYIYLPDRHADKNLSIPAFQKFLPFACPQGVTDQEVIDIVRFVRSGPCLVTTKNQTPSYYSRHLCLNSLLFASPTMGETSNISRPKRVDTTLPILLIKRLEDDDKEEENKIDDIIEIMTGTQFAPLGGIGEIIRIKRTDTGYALIYLSVWVS